MANPLRRSTEPLVIELEVKVEVEGQFPDFHYNPATLRAGAGDHIRWKIKAGGGERFVVHFAVTPFEKVEFRGGPNDMAPVAFRNGVAPGAYKYAVAIEKGGALYMDSCPEVVVDI